MPAKLKYGGSFSSTETSLISFTITDILYAPNTLIATIANPNGALDDRYNNFDEIEIVEDTTNLVLFRGRIYDIKKPIHPRYGGVVRLTAFDNLQELARKTIHDGEYSENGRDELIRAIIDEHTHLGDTSIDTANHLGSKLLSSADTDAKTVSIKGSGRTPLSVIKEEAQDDPWDGTVTSNTNRGFAFYLDDSLDFNYHKLGTVPLDPDSGSMGNSGLTVEYGLAAQTMNGAEPSKMQMLPGSSFNEPGNQVVTQVRLSYQSAGNEVKSLVVQRFAHGTVTNGPFDGPHPLTGATQLVTNSGGTGVRVQFVEDGAILVSHVDEENATVAIPTFSDGTTITQQSSTDSGGERSPYPYANLATPHTPAGLTKMGLEKSVSGFQYVDKVGELFSGKTKALEKAASILRKGFSVTGQKTGTFTVMGFPEYRIGSTYYPVRAGTQIGVKNTITANVDNEDMTVLSIVHTQAAGEWSSIIEVIDKNEGTEIVSSKASAAAEKLDDKAPENPATIGDQDLTTLGDDLDITCQFTRDSRTQISWTAGFYTTATGQHIKIAAGDSADANMLNAQMATDGTKYYLMVFRENAAADERLHIEAGIPNWTAAATGTTTTITEPCTTSATSLTVASSSSFAAGNYIKIDDEYMYVSAVPDGTHLTVQRGFLRISGDSNFTFTARKGHADNATVTLYTFTNPNNNFDAPANAQFRNRKIIGTVKAGAVAEQYAELVLNVTGPSIVGGGNNTVSSVSALSTDLGAMDTGQHLTLNTATPSGSVPITNPHGIFRYSLDGNGDANPTLGFLSGQTSATPATATNQSAFWSMLSESDGSTGSRLILEPIIDYDSSDTTKNRAFIGWHNPLFAIYGYYLNAGNGNASFPSHSFYGDVNTGMFLNSSDTIGFSAGGTARAYIDSNGIYATATVASDIEVNINSSSGLFTKVSSSRRYKDNIEDLDIHTENIYDLRPVSFDWKSNGKPDFGFIAEEVHEILPELTIYDDQNRPEAVKYKQLSILMLEELKKLREEVKDLKEKV
mgnify:FL=1